MYNIEFVGKNDEEISEFIDNEFNKYADKNDLICNYNSFAFVAKDDEKIVGVITGHSYYDEVHISDFVVLEDYRGKGIGTSLIRKAEEYHKNKGFESINLTTYEFQVPKFYERNGYKLEFVRENKSNPKLSKYFFIKKLSISEC